MQAERAALVVRERRPLVEERNIQEILSPEPRKRGVSPFRGTTRRRQRRRAWACARGFHRVSVGAPSDVGALKAA